MMRRLLPLILLAGCASPPEYIEITPECEVPPRPSLPAIPAEDLEALPDETYFDLERREKRIVDWSLELEAIVRELCRESDTPEDENARLRPDFSPS